jgi:thymidylate synthase
MSGIPVLSVEGKGIAEAWENSLVELFQHGCTLKTQYDKAEDPPSLDATMVITVHEPLSEPMIHRDLPCGFEELQEYVMEVCEGIKDHLVRDPDDPSDTRWEYTYHQRLCRYSASGFGPIDQLESILTQLTEAPYTRRAQAITWKVWEDATCYDPPCLQSIWCRITSEADRPVLNMNVRFRSNDAYKAALMNIFALCRLQESIAGRLTHASGRAIGVGRYVHMADSYHIYGTNLPEFKARFLGALENRSFAERTMRYEDVKDMMEGARSSILAKAQKMGRRP